MDEEHRYWIQLLSSIQVLVGGYLALEHIATWGGTDLVFGHEWYGLILVFTGILTGLFSKRKHEGITKDCD